MTSLTTTARADVGAADAPARAGAITLAEAFQRCAEVTRRRARNFYYGLRLTPEPKRSAIYSVYAWLRDADDEADSDQSIGRRRERLAQRRAALTRFLAGEPAPADDAAWVALADTISRYPVDPADLFAMLDGLDEDLAHDGYETRDDLERYCHRVASTVGQICLAIWGVRTGLDLAEARGLARRRGVAFQLTNILRDFGQDFDEGRVYLPRESFTQAGLTPERLRQWNDNAACEAMVLGLAAWAREEYRASAPLDRMVDPACAPTLWAMTRIYSGLLTCIERTPSRIALGPRIRLHSAHKGMIAICAGARARIAR